MHKIPQPPPLVCDYHRQRIIQMEKINWINFAPLPQNLIQLKCSYIDIYREGVSWYWRAYTTKTLWILSIQYILIYTEAHLTIILISTLCFGKLLLQSFFLLFKTLPYIYYILRISIRNASRYIVIYKYGKCKQYNV